MFNNQIIAGSSGQGGSFYPYSIDQSLRFDRVGSAHLNFTPSSAGNQKTWTWSAWIKRSTLGVYQNIFNPSRGGDGANESQMAFQAGDGFQIYDSGATRGNKVTTRVFRDTSSWYHIVVALDTTEATAEDRVKIYVNGERETLFSTNSNPALNTDWGWNAAREHALGSYNYSTDTNFFGGYMAEVYFIDGTALDATSFGETINGIWVPKAYSGSYGTNGFYLSFADSAAIGDDLSGNANDWTANNLAASDVVPDSPTLNYPTWNPLVNTGQTLTFAEGNLNLDASGTFWSSGTWNQSTMGVLGGSDAKYYFEFTMNGNTSGSYVIGVGRQNSSAIDTTHYTGGVVYYYNRCSSDATNTVTGLTIASSLTIIRLAFDASNGKVWIGDNTGWFNSGDPAAGTGEVGTISGYDGEMLVAILNRSTNTGDQVVNFGQDDTFAGFKTSGSASATDDNGYGTFYYTPPTGFLALNSASLPEPTIGPNSTTTSDEHFNTVLYTGNGTDDTAITGVGHQPDLVWVKTRSAASTHILSDSVRGATKQLFSNLTNAEQTDTTKIKSFDADGFTLGTDASGTGSSNTNTVTYVGWSWKAGGTAVSNTDGSITSSVSANPDAGFSVVTYSGTLSGTGTASVGHGLGVRPNMVIAKSRNVSGGDAGDWAIWHDDLSTDNYVLRFNTAAESNKAGNGDMSSLFTATTFGTNYTSGLNVTGNNYVAYCFANTEGHLKCGSYVGNSSTDGTFVYTGFRVAFLLTKSTSSGTQWMIYDSKREGYNVDNDALTADDTAIEKTDDDVDFLSNGFKWRRSSPNFNQSTYVYIAFAEQPFKYANAR